MKIVILGGGISGLLAAYVLRKHKPILLEGRSEMGGDYTAGGLKYIRSTSPFRRLLRDLGVQWRPYQPCGMLFSRGKSHPHPDWLMGLDASDRLPIQVKHWKKTRGDTEGFRNDCMNDPAGEGNDGALKCDHSELISALAYRAALDGAELRTRATIGSVSRERVIVGDESLWYDRLVTTLPIAVMSRLAPWARLPQPRPNDLTIVDLSSPFGHDPEWDYMYTPMAQHVSRINWNGRGSFQSEAPGIVTPYHVHVETTQILIELGLVETLEMGSHLTKRPFRTIPGHLPPLDDVKWHETWLPLGRFAEWNPRSTAEKTLDRVIGWADGL